MATDTPFVLQDRRSECDVLERLLEAVRGGESRVLVVSGEAGVGKSALLEYMVGRASGCRVASAAGGQSVMGIGFGGLPRLFAPMHDQLGALPAALRGSVGTGCGLA